MPKEKNAVRVASHETGSVYNVCISGKDRGQQQNILFRIIFQMGPFYELESASPALFLAPGQSHTHHHTVFHFTGPEIALDAICQKVLGVSIEKIKSALN